MIKNSEFLLIIKVNVGDRDTHDCDHWQSLNMESNYRKNRKKSISTVIVSKNTLIYIKF